MLVECYGGEENVTVMVIERLSGKCRSRGKVGDLEVKFVEYDKGLGGNVWKMLLWVIEREVCGMQRRRKNV